MRATEIFRSMFDYCGGSNRRGRLGGAVSPKDSPTSALAEAGSQLVNASADRVDVSGERTQLCS